MDLALNFYITVVFMRCEQLRFSEMSVFWWRKPHIFNALAELILTSGYAGNMSLKS